MIRSAFWISHVVLVTASMTYAQQPEQVGFSGRNDGSAEADKDSRVLLDGVTETQLFQLESSINGLAVSTDGRYLAAVSQSGTLGIWDFESGGMHSKNRHRDGPLYAVAFHAEKNMIAYGGVGETLHFWDLDNDLHEAVKSAQSGTSAVVFVHEGVVSGGVDGTVRFFNPGNLQGIVMRERHRKKVVHLTFAQLHGTRKVPAGSTLVVSVDESGLMRLWNNGQHMAQKKGSARGVRYAQFVSRNSERLFFSAGATARGDWLDVKLRDNYGRVCRKIPVREIRRVSIDDSVQLRSVWTTKKVCKTEYLGTTATLKETPTKVGDALGDILALSPRGDRLASVGPESMDIWVLWDESPKLSRSLDWSTNEVVKSVIWTADSSGLITGSESGAVRIHRD